MPRSRRGISRPHSVDQPSEPAVGKVDAEQTAEREAPLLYTAEQAATLLQVRPSWLRRKAAARAVPCRFIGKHLRFSRTDIDTIAENSATPPQRFS
jgi:excisionase family DNA binding protein